MPQVTIEFDVRHVDKPERAYASDVSITDASAAREISALGFEFNEVNHGGIVGRIKVRAPEGDPRIQRIYDILAILGFRPCARLNPPSKTNYYEFSVIKRRTYSTEEISAAPLLRLRSSTTAQDIADTCYPTGGPRLAPADWEKYLRKSLGNDVEGWRVKANSRLKKPMHFGRLAGIFAVLISAELRQTLEKSGLIGLNFIPVRYDHPEKAARQLFQFGHQVQMPKCLTPRLNQSGEDWQENDPNGGIWDDAGYFPEELRFRRKEVEAMGEFDMATTREVIGANSAFYHSEVIVSQRLRTVMDDFGIKTAEYSPVRLVD